MFIIVQQEILPGIKVLLLKNNIGLFLKQLKQVVQKLNNMLIINPKAITYKIQLNWTLNPHKTGFYTTAFKAAKEEEGIHVQHHISSISLVSSSILD